LRFVWMACFAAGDMPFAIGIPHRVGAALPQELATSGGSRAATTRRPRAGRDAGQSEMRGEALLALGETSVGAAA
jgi:hypothetical protein